MKNTLQTGIVTVFILLIAVAGTSYAAPQISDVNCNFQHGQTAIITGIDFDQKDPALPIWWDDCEGAPVNNTSVFLQEQSWIISGFLTGNYKKYTDAWPRAYNGDNEDALAAKIQYRNENFRNVSTPHPYSSQYLSGGHYVFPNPRPNLQADPSQYDPTYLASPSYDFSNVMVSVNSIMLPEGATALDYSNAANKTIWFATWYYRLDPQWSTTYHDSNGNSYNPPSVVPGRDNHKMDVVNRGDDAYANTDSDNEKFAYTAYGNSPSEAEENNCRIGTDHAMRQTYPGFQGLNPVPDSNNPRLDWIRYEHRSQSDDLIGIRDIYIDNFRAGYLEDRNTGEQNFPNWFGGYSNMFTVGGYYRWAYDISDIYTYYGGVNCYRFFDDIYIDNTWSRVILANNSNYENATITEPQIPTAWSTNSITITVNLGKLTGNSAYLFVFDIDNNCNPIGYPIEIDNTYISSCDDLDNDNDIDGEDLLFLVNNFDLTDLEPFAKAFGYICQY